MAITEILFFLFLEIVLPLAIVALMHYKLSKYPKPLTLDKNKKKVILETLVFWALAMIVLTLIMFSSIAKKMADPTGNTLLLFILITAVPYILIPVLYLRIGKKWTWKDFGFRMPLPKTNAIMIFSIILFAIAGGVLPLLNSNFVPLSIMMILFAIWQPAFIEEFFFRGVIQGNLERAIGQNKAWIYGGILFGLIHLPFNYIIGGMDLISGFFMFLTQVIAGWIFGILYMKTRSLWPGMLVHFITDSRLASIIATIT